MLSADLRYEPIDHPDLCRLAVFQILKHAGLGGARHLVHTQEQLLVVVKHGLIFQGKGVGRIAENQCGHGAAVGLTALPHFPAYVAQARSGVLLVQHLAKGTGAGRRHAAHAGVVYQLAPAGVHEGPGNACGLAHEAQNFRYFLNAGGQGAVDFSDFKQMVVVCDILGQLGNAGLNEGGAP
ncbi:hypothetical protein SDC9_118547 [bioreactor metagenome]|uniref:Uncharacterized protein n=1 Tax=bioreactor metagenome TaxID=1076179 RepID=A0A645C1R5_9ZZZZ